MFEGVDHLPFGALRQWFLKERRELPWRGRTDPYKIWVSEVMLQQTRASVVIPYFNRWMAALPTLSSLAAASEAEVMKLWEGLGYYSRVRNLLKGARHCVQHHGGFLPSTREALAAVPGIGPYTLGAILSFAFHQRAPAVDGNVERVLLRFVGSEEKSGEAATRRSLERALARALPEQAPWEVVEGLIELGALICQPSPNCESCPLASSCRAYALGMQKELPRRKARPPTTLLHRSVALISSSEGGLLVQQRREGKLMAGLYELPYCDLAEASTPTQRQEWMEELLTSPVELLGELPAVSHSFTRYRATLYPFLCIPKGSVDLAKSGLEWVEREGLTALACSAGHRKILNHWLEKF